MHTRKTRDIFSFSFKFGFGGWSFIMNFLSSPAVVVCWVTHTHTHTHSCDKSVISPGMLGTLGTDDGSFSLPLNWLKEKKTERNLNNKLINFLKLRTISFDGMDLDSRISSEKSTPSPPNSFPTFFKNFRCFYFCIDW